MIAIALYLRSPILILDGADVLDNLNRIALMRFLLKEAAEVKGDMTSTDFDGWAGRRDRSPVNES